MSDKSTPLLVVFDTHRFLENLLYGILAVEKLCLCRLIPTVYRPDPPLALSMAIFDRASVFMDKPGSIPQVRQSGDVLVNHCTLL